MLPVAVICRLSVTSPAARRRPRESYRRRAGRRRETGAEAMQVMRFSIPYYATKRRICQFFQKKCGVFSRLAISMRKNGRKFRVFWHEATIRSHPGGKRKPVAFSGKPWTPPTFNMVRYVPSARLLSPLRCAQPCFWAGYARVQIPIASLFSTQTFPGWRWWKIRWQGDVPIRPPPPRNWLPMSSRNQACATRPIKTRCTVGAISAERFV